MNKTDHKFQGIMPSVSMNNTKQILALLRAGDFAHPGEIEAIDLALSPITKEYHA
jgi:hypothetical protein